MVMLDLNLDGEGAFQAEELEAGEPLPFGEVFRVAALPGGMESGLPSVAVGIRLPDGRVVVGQTSARAFCRAGEAIRARYPAIDSDG